jgi:RNA polymerase sigma-70 factor (ECF subfamily)
MPLDARVHELLAEGDTRTAAAIVIQKLGPRILGYLRTILRDEADAGEAFSVFAEHLWRGIGTFRGDASIRTWAFKVAWNAALNVRGDAWRRLGRRLVTGEASRLAEEIRTATVERFERQRDALAILREALSPEEQTLLALRIDQKLAWEEIAHVLSGEGAPVEAVALRKRFERLKERLGRLARERGLIE